MLFALVIFSWLLPIHVKSLIRNTSYFPSESVYFWLQNHFPHTQGKSRMTVEKLIPQKSVLLIIDRDLVNK